MEDYTLAWGDPAAVIQNEEVICDIETEIIPGHSEEFQETEEELVEHNGQEEIIEEVDDSNIMYELNENNMIVMHRQDNGKHYEQNFMEVTEEVVADQWDESCPEEIVIGSEEAVGDDQGDGDIAIPLPNEQDEYLSSRPYPCDFCSRRFRKKANLMNHMVSHQTDRPHGCNLCGVRYIRKCDLMNHLKIHAYIPETDEVEEEDGQQMDEHEMEEKMRRNRKPGKKRKKKIKEEFEVYTEEHQVVAGGSGEYSFVNEEMVMSEDVKEDFPEYVEEATEEVRYPIIDMRKPFVCQHCGVGFAREKALASHARIHGGDSPFECQKCGEMFWDMNAMREHLRIKHGEIHEEYDDDDDQDATYSEDDTKYGTFYCPTCGLSFHRQDNLRRHQRIHIKEELLTDQQEMGHVCNVCGESFSEALDLLAHAEIHARVSEHRCMICGEDFEDDRGCAAHVQQSHGDDLPINSCMLCGRQCKDRRTLLKHSWEHSKEKVFSCSKCAKTFHNKARLKRHMFSHRSKAVTCDVCGEEFPDGRSLMNHRHSHSNVSGRQFPCRECGKTFGSRSSQQIHIRIHTGERPYGCRFCWKAFADGGTLRKHERIHTGEKPYACAVCPRAFNQRVVLREHIRSHHSGPDPKYASSMTPYCCSVCSDMFATSQDLIIHLIHHCDMNTAMKRQPQVGPRKYKRRRKLKPHELELLAGRIEDDGEHDSQMDHNDYAITHGIPVVGEVIKRKVNVTKKKKALRNEMQMDMGEQNYMMMSPEQVQEETVGPSLAMESINSIVNAKTSPLTPMKQKKKIKNELPGVVGVSRPKMIHTQKTRVAVEPGEDGRVRHRTKTTITRTHPSEVKLVTGERIRPRTKNVSYHVFSQDKLPLATFPEPEDQTAVSNLLKETESNEYQHGIMEDKTEPNGILYMDPAEDTPEIASEETIISETAIEEPQVAMPEDMMQQQVQPVPQTLIRIETRSSRRNNQHYAQEENGSLKPGKHIIGPGSKIRLVKGGMIVSKKGKKHILKEEPEEILPHGPVSTSTIEPDINDVHIKQEIVEMKQELIEQSPLHELAEISMQHAQNLFKCEMCSEVFSDRAQLLVHVPIHI